MQELQEVNEGIVLSEADQIWRNELIRQVAKETRLPVVRVMMLTWAQFDAPNKITTPTRREVQLSSTLGLAIARLPRMGRWIFSMTPFPPTIPDEYLEPAREYLANRAIEAPAKKKRRRLQITFR